MTLKKRRPCVAVCNRNQPSTTPTEFTTGRRNPIASTPYSKNCRVLRSFIRAEPQETFSPRGSESQVPPKMNDCQPCNLTRTASEISPTDPSPHPPRAAIPPLPLPVGRCAPYLRDCAQPPRWPAPASPLPPHPRQASGHIAILSSPAAEAAPSP